MTRFRSKDFRPSNDTGVIRTPEKPLKPSNGPLRAAQGDSRRYPRMRLWFTGRVWRAHWRENPEGRGDRPCYASWATLTDAHTMAEWLVAKAWAETP